MRDCQNKIGNTLGCRLRHALDTGGKNAHRNKTDWEDEGRRQQEGNMEARKRGSETKHRHDWRNIHRRHDRLIINSNLKHLHNAMEEINER